MNKLERLKQWEAESSNIIFFDGNALCGAVPGLASTGMLQLLKQWIDNGGK